jgi:hypothetical protein
MHDPAVSSAAASKPSGLKSGLRVHTHTSPVGDMSPADFSLLAIDEITSSFDARLIIHRRIGRVDLLRRDTGLVLRDR